MSTSVSLKIVTKVFGPEPRYGSNRQVVNEVNHASHIRFFPTLFCGEACDAREIAELKRLATPIRFEGGQTIFSEGDPATRAFGLSHGVVRLYRVLPDGRRQVVAFAFPGDFLAMPLADRFSLSADAVGQVGVCRFPREELKRFIENSPNIMRLLIEFAARELQSAQDQLTLLGSGSAEERVAAFLVN